MRPWCQLRPARSKEGLSRTFSCLILRYSTLQLSYEWCVTVASAHVHGHLLVAPASACATVAEASCRSTVYQQFERCAMQIHIVAVVISFLKLFDGTKRDGQRHQSRRRRLAFLPRLCLKEDNVLTIVVVCRRVESCRHAEFLEPTLFFVPCGTLRQIWFQSRHRVHPTLREKFVVKALSSVKHESSLQPTCGRKVGLPGFAFAKTALFSLPSAVPTVDFHDLSMFPVFLACSAHFRSCLSMPPGNLCHAGGWHLRRKPRVALLLRLHHCLFGRRCA